MFICRHRLLRAYLPRHFTSIALPCAPIVPHLQRVLPAPLRHASSTPSRALERWTNTKEGEKGRGRGNIIGNDSISSTDEESSQHASASPVHQTKRKTESSSLPFYFEKRGRDRLSVAALSSRHVMDAINYAVESGNEDLFKVLFEDIVTSYRGRQNRDRMPVTCHLLSLTCDDRWKKMLGRDRLLRILRYLEARELLRRIPTHILYGCTQVILNRRPIATDVPILILLTPVLLYRLDESKIHNHLTDSTPNTVWLLFQGMQRLLQLKRPSQVLEIFQKLVEKGDIPASALEGIDVTSGNFDHIIIAVLVRCCLQWGWKDRAINMVQFSLDRGARLAHALCDVAVNVLEVLLTGTEAHTEQVTSILTGLLSNAEDGFTVPHEVLATFYDHVRLHRAGDAASDIYRLTRSPQVSEKHRYPPPLQSNLVWVLQNAFRNRNVHVARLLAKQIVEDDVEIPYLARPNMISQMASFGFTLEVRALWERYASRGDGIIVKASTSILTRIISLCIGRIRILENRRRMVEGKQTLVESLALPVGDSMTPPSPDGSSDGVTSQPTDVLIDPITAGEDLEEGHETMSYEERIESVRAFAGRVMDTFIESIGSLQHASHFELNALSRAYFQMNKISEGFDTLKIILDRKEIPDPHDINVALSALSAHDPREATQMIRRMVDLGLTPDSVTFGTVIHHAVLHNDSALVTILIKLAKRVGVEHLDYKTLGTLIRGAVTEFGEDDPEAQLRTAQELMDALLNAGFVPSPAMGMDCILAALHASDPVAAFKFWKLIVKDKVDWKDFKQVVYRARIARAIRRYYKEKSLDPDKSRAMLSELGVDPSLERRYRQNAAATQA